MSHLTCYARFCNTDITIIVGCPPYVSAHPTASHPSVADDDMPPLAFVFHAHRGSRIFRDFGVDIVRKEEDQQEVSVDVAAPEHILEAWNRE